MMRHTVALFVSVVLLGLCTLTAFPQSISVLYAPAALAGGGGTGTAGTPYSVYVQIQGWTAAANGQVYLKIYSSTYNEYMWTGSVWSNGTTYAASNQPVVNIDAAGNWSGWIHAKHNADLGSSASVRAAIVAATGTRLTSSSRPFTVLDMQGAGNGGWLFSPSTSEGNKGILAYAGSAIAGVYRTEENGITEGYFYGSGGFKIAVPAGYIDSLVTINDDGSRSQVFRGPWLVTAGQETDASVSGGNAGRGSVRLLPQTLSGDTPQDLSVTFFGETPYVLTNVRVRIPPTWSWSHTAADITCTGAGSPVVTVAGDTVVVAGMALSGADSMLLTVRSVTPADSTARFAFHTRTGTHPDSLAALTAQPSIFVYSIPLPVSTAKLNDAYGMPLRNNTLVTVRGIVTVANEFGGPSYVQDNTGGMAVYGSAFSSAVAIGDEVIVSGLVQPYAGLMEIVNPQLHHIVTSGNTVDPVTVTAKEIRRDGAGGVELYEGRLVRVNNVHVGGSGAWTANANYALVDGTDSTEIRIDGSTNLAGSPIPASACDIVGVVGQYITSSPYIGGYQLMPRSTADVRVTGPGISSVPLETDLTASSFTIGWTTTLPGTSGLRYGKTKSYELGVVAPDSLMRATHAVPVTGLEAATIYHVQVFSTNGTDTSTAGDHVVSTASPLQATGTIRAYFNKSVVTSLDPGDPAAGNQNFVALLVNRIASAKHSVDAAFYSLSGTPGPGTDIAAALIAARQRGVRVRVICEQDNRNTAPLNSLATAGVPLITDAYDAANAGAGLMHNKFAVIDAYGGAPESVWVWTGSWNPTEPGTNDDYQNVVEIQDPALAGAYTLEFNEMWGSAGAVPDAAASRFGARKTDNTPHHFRIGGRPVSCYFSPSDNATARIIDAVNTADLSAHFALLTFTRTDIADALLARKAAGVAVHGVMDNREDTGSRYDALVAQGMDIRLKTGSGLLHHKYAVIDAGAPGSRPVVITGSHNWSSSAEDRNGENTLFIEDAALAVQYLQEFAARYYQFGGSDTIRVSVDQLSDEMPKAYALLQNYPNPFNGMTSIRFTVRTSGTTAQRVELKVFDLLGREVATLVDGPLAAGEYRVSFDASSIASGMYLYTMRVGEFREVKRMVLLR
jgi:phosphatidylserine/phosphatidylglycerophosphate/cardiolipin synthase-like enzyme